jgi:peroxiredoxin Q/BCP
MSKARDIRINRMSEAFRRLSEVLNVPGELEALAPEVGLLKEYMASGQWLKDFEADEKGEIGPGVDRSVLSEDGLYNLLDELKYKINNISMLKIGDRMPSFEVLDQDGATVKSEDFIGKGRKTIIYFYPKDNTSGCTAEACSFRDNYAELTAAGYNVVGVSKDSAKSHTGFRARYELPFRLLADTSTQMLQDFGAWGEKKMYGKSTMGTLRRTFIFDENGILERIIEKVDTKNAATQILEG